MPIGSAIPYLYPPPLCECYADQKHKWYVRLLSLYVSWPGFTESQSVCFQVRIHLREVRAWRYGKVPREIDCKHHDDENPELDVVGDWLHANNSCEMLAFH